MKFLRVHNLRGPIIDKSAHVAMQGIWRTTAPCGNQIMQWVMCATSRVFDEMIPGGLEKSLRVCQINQARHFRKDLPFLFLGFLLRKIDEYMQSM